MVGGSHEPTGELGRLPATGAQLAAAEPRMLLDDPESLFARYRDALVTSGVVLDDGGLGTAGFGDVFDTWASMSHLLPMEAWPPEAGPRSIAYFCGAMPDADPANREAAMIGEFASKLVAGETLAIDQLLNFLHLVGGPEPLPDGTRDRIRQVLLRPLGD